MTRSMAQVNSPLALVFLLAELDPLLALSVRRTIVVASQLWYLASHPDH